MCHSCPNLVHGIVPEVYYLHEVCHSCTNLVHGIVPEVYYLHEVCHSCPNLVHGIVPEVYYLHEVCHSCTNLVHGIVPEVYYLHEVCHSCPNLVHGIVPEVYYLHEVCHSCPKGPWKNYARVPTRAHACGRGRSGKEHGRVLLRAIACHSLYLRPSEHESSPHYRGPLSVRFVRWFNVDKKTRRRDKGMNGL